MLADDRPRRLDPDPDGESVEPDREDEPDDREVDDPDDREEDREVVDPDERDDDDDREEDPDEREDRDCDDVEEPVVRDDPDVPLAVVPVSPLVADEDPDDDPSPSLTGDHWSAAGRPSRRFAT